MAFSSGKVKGRVKDAKDCIWQHKESRSIVEAIKKIPCKTQFQIRNQIKSATKKVDNNKINLVVFKTGDFEGLSLVTQNEGQ